MRLEITTIQEAIRANGADAWVLYDFRGTNDLAWSILSIPRDAHCTRRWMVVIPAQGHAVKIVHRMEQDPLSHVRTVEKHYASRQEWEDVIKETLAPYKTIAIEYSPMNAIPVVSKVDAGTIEFIRSLGHTVISSGDIVQRFTATLTTDQIAGAEVTAGQVRDAIFLGFKMVRERLLAGERVTEYDVQQTILAEFDRLDLETDTPPIVAIGPNAASPHYAPSMTRTSEITADMVVLIDAWAKRRAVGSVFADLTWVGYTGTEVPSDVARTFDIIVRGRNAAIDLVRARFEANEAIYGYEVDRACRTVIEDAGLGSHFIHRTGHSITTQIHGPGVNMDDFETHDTRRILPSTSFSIEPGLYFAQSLGLRTEVDVIVLSDGTVTVPSAPLQQSVLPLLADEWEQ